MLHVGITIYYRAFGPEGAEETEKVQQFAYRVMRVMPHIVKKVFDAHSLLATFRYMQAVLPLDGFSTDGDCLTIKLEIPKEWKGRSEDPHAALSEGLRSYFGSQGFSSASELEDHSGRVTVGIVLEFKEASSSEVLLAENVS